MYFSSFPGIAYQFDGEFNKRIVVDIMKRVKVRDQIITTATIYQPYYVRDGETPNIVADKFYGSSEYHWIILLTNQIIDPFFDWPLDETTLKLFVKNKYPGTFTSGMDQIPNYYAIHHYELVSPYAWRNGMYMPTPDEFSTFTPEYTAKLFNPDLEEIVPVTNFEYEESLNDNKRSILLMKKELANEFIKEFRTLIKT